MRVITLEISTASCRTQFPDRTPQRDMASRLEDGGILRTKIIIRSWEKMKKKSVMAAHTGKAQCVSPGTKICCKNPEKGIKEKESHRHLPTIRRDSNQLAFFIWE